MTAVRPGIVLIDFCIRKRHCSIGSRCSRGLKTQKMIACDEELRDREPATVKNCPTLGSASIFLIHQLLKSPHLLGRRTFLGNENASGKAAVSGRKERERQMSKEKPETENASEQDRNGQPGAVEKFIESTAVDIDHAFDEIARPFFHPRAFMAGPAFAEDARAHQWRQRQRNKT